MIENHPSFWARIANDKDQSAINCNGSIYQRTFKIQYRYLNTKGYLRKIFLVDICRYLIKTFFSSELHLENGTHYKSTI